MRVLGVVRVSTKEQATDAHYSFAAQRTRIRAYCHDRHWDLVDIVEYVQSGGSNRRELREILARVQRDRIQCIVVNELDRLTRDMVSTMLFLEELQRVGCRFASVSDDLDLTTPDGELKMMMLAMFAHYFRRQLSRKVKGGQAERAKQGKRHGERPFGYRPHGDSWVPDPQEAPVVQQIFQWYLQDRLGFRAIAQRLNAAGIPGQRGRSGTWDVRTVERLLRREAYVGDTIYGRWIQETDREGHTHVHRQTPQIIRDTHPAIIDRATWNQVQERLRIRQSMGRRTHDSPYLFSGLVRCGACGASMVVVRTGRRQPDGRRAPVYCCRAYHTKGQCSTATKIPVADLDAAVLGALREEFRQVQTAPTPEQVARWLGDDPVMAQAQAARHRAAQRLAAIPAMLARAEEMALAGAYTIDEYKQAKARLLAEQAECEAVLHAPWPQLDDPQRLAARVAALIPQLEAALTADVATARPWIQSVVERIVCHPGRHITVTWRSAGEDVCPVTVGALQRPSE
ncbi:recombinase family protein [Sulfobacillus thermosulfidooxidans]|uniref:recombinase family protein n=1 Tax=Sulfobacillus thermosulfidooxidans TaxID=28034 RepID=UPI0002E276E6|nr:recombinase family protein [Sulfobacillus thermosulfidooxidans]